MSEFLETLFYHLALTLQNHLNLIFMTFINKNYLTKDISLRESGEYETYYQ